MAKIVVFLLSKDDKELLPSFKFTLYVPNKVLMWYVKLTTSPAILGSQTKDGGGGYLFWSLVWVNLRQCGISQSESSADEGHQVQAGHMLEIKDYFHIGQITQDRYSGWTVFFPLFLEVHYGPLECYYAGPGPAWYNIHICGQYVSLSDIFPVCVLFKPSGA
jgi:hypothetical protein